MAIQAIWVEQNKVEVGDFLARCKRCGAQSLRDSVVHYSVVVYAFFFGFIKRFELFGTCPSCGEVVRVPATELQTLRSAVPFMQRFGCLTIAIAGVLAAATFFIINNFLR